MGALCEVGIAFEKAKRVAQSGDKANEVKKALMAQFSENCTSVNANSPPVHLGKLFVCIILKALVQFSAQPSSQLDVLSNCMSHLAMCANQCPSFLAGENSSLEVTMRACMSIAQINNSRDDEDVIFLKLSALDVFVTITAVPQIKHSIMKLTKLSPLDEELQQRAGLPIRFTH